MADQDRRDFGKIRRWRSGRYGASYLGPDGDRHSSPLTYDRREDAEGWLRDERRYLALVGVEAWKPPKARAEAAAPKITRDKRTLREYADHWIATKRATRDITATTAEKYRQAMRMRVLDFDGRPALGDIAVTDLTDKQIRSWWRKLDHDHERACDLAYQALRAMLNFAVEDGMITTNPCHIRGAGAAAAERSIEPLTPAEVSAAAALMPEQWAIGVHLGAWCALRSGEVRELRRRDVLLDATPPVLRVRQAVVRAEGKLQTTKTKTDAGMRTILLSAPMVARLRAHLDDHARPGPDGLLVSATDGGHIHDGTWWRAWDRARRKIGHPGFRFHDLRHTGLTYAATAGATIRELQSMAGHTTPAMAMRYQEVASAHMAGVVERLGMLDTPTVKPAGMKITRRTRRAG